jgi:hypothetical protein
MHDKVPVFIAEIAPKNLRGALTTINQVNIYTRTNWRNNILISSCEARNIFSCEVAFIFLIMKRQKHNANLTSFKL